ncbi:Hypothetical protein POVN_LOCUS316 [uncultured virus]|nr:Hypothetical protein POVN_LOCUS316 [uncultured virus]
MLSIYAEDPTRQQHYVQLLIKKGTIHNGFLDLKVPLEYPTLYHFLNQEDKPTVSYSEVELTQWYAGFTDEERLMVAVWVRLELLQLLQEQGVSPLCLKGLQCRTGYTQLELHELVHYQPDRCVSMLDAVVRHQAAEILLMMQVPTNPARTGKSGWEALAEKLVLSRQYDLHEWSTFLAGHPTEVPYMPLVVAPTYHELVGLPRSPYYERFLACNLPDNLMCPSKEYNCKDLTVQLS